MKIRAHASPSDVITLLERGDKTAEQVQRKLKLSANQTRLLLSEMVHGGLIATTGKNEHRKYTIIKIADVEDWK